MGEKTKKRIEEDAMKSRHRRMFRSMLLSNISLQKNIPFDELEEHECESDSGLLIRFGG